MAASRMPDLDHRAQRQNKQKLPKQYLTAARVRRRVTPDDASRLTACARVTGRGGRIEREFLLEQGEVRARSALLL